MGDNQNPSLNESKSVRFIEGKQVGGDYPIKYFPFTPGIEVPQSPRENDRVEVTQNKEISGGGEYIEKLGSTFTIR